MRRIKLIIIAVLVVLVTLFIKMHTTKAMENYQTVGTPTGIVTATTLNIRQGPRNRIWCNSKSK